jgi:hypothetical protein
MGTGKREHKAMVKISEYHSHSIYRCRQCGTELVLLFDRWEPCFPGWLPRLA